MRLQYINEIRRFLRALYSGIGKSFVILPSAFLVATGSSIVELGIIFYIKEIYGATASQVGILTGLWSFSYIIGCVFIRPIFKRVLPRFLLIGSSLFMCIFILLVLTTKIFATALIDYSLYGFSMAFFWPTMLGWLSKDAEGARLGKSISYFNLSWSAGIIVGPFLAGILSAISPEIPLYAGSSLFLLTVVLITGASFSLPKVRSDRDVDAAAGRDTLKSEKGTVLRFPGWVGMFTTFVAFGVIVNIFPVFAVDDLAMSKQVVGVVMQSRTFLAIFFFIILGHTTFWHFRISQMIAGQILLAVVIYLMIFTSSPLILALLIAWAGALRALSYSNSVFHGVSGSINRTERMAVHEALLAGGLIFGSLLGGVIYQYYGMAAVYYFCAAVVMLGAVIQGILFLLLHKRDDKIAGIL